MGLFTRSSAFSTEKQGLNLCKNILSYFFGFAILLSLLSFNLNDSIDIESRDYLTENSSFVSTVLEPSYFVLEEIPGEFRMVKAVFSDYEIILRPQSIEYFATNGADDMAHFAFENCNQNVRPDGMKQVSSEEVPIKNKAMAEVLQAKGAASKFSMKPRFVASDYNSTQKSIALPKSNRSLKIKSNNDKIDFVEGNGFKGQRPEQYSENSSSDITLK